MHDSGVVTLFPVHHTDTPPYPTLIGDVEDPPPPQSTTIEIASTSKTSWATGHYLLPGQELHLQVLSLHDETWREFELMIGCHGDKLKNKKSLYRFPQVQVRGSECK